MEIVRKVEAKVFFDFEIKNFVILLKWNVKNKIWLWRIIFFSHSCDS